MKNVWFYESELDKLRIALKVNKTITYDFTDGCLKASNSSAVIKLMVGGTDYHSGPVNIIFSKSIPKTWTVAFINFNEMVIDGFNGVPIPFDIVGGYSCHPVRINTVSDENEHPVVIDIEVLSDIFSAVRKLNTVNSNAQLKMINESTAQVNLQGSVVGFTDDDIILISTGDDYNDLY